MKLEHTRFVVSPAGSVLGLPAGDYWAVPDAELRRLQADANALWAFRVIKRVQLKEGVTVLTEEQRYERAVAMVAENPTLGDAKPYLDAEEWGVEGTATQKQSQVTAGGDPGVVIRDDLEPPFSILIERKDLTRERFDPDYVFPVGQPSPREVAESLTTDELAARIVAAHPQWVFEQTIYLERLGVNEGPEGVSRAHAALEKLLADRSATRKQ